MSVKPFRARGGFFIPEEIARRSGRKLNRTQLDIVEFVDRMSHLKAGCYASNQYIADSLDISRRHAIRYIKELIELGVLKVAGTVKVNGRNHRLLELVTIAKDDVFVGMFSDKNDTQCITLKSNTKKRGELQPSEATAADAASPPVPSTPAPTTSKPEKKMNTVLFTVNTTSSPACGRKPVPAKEDIECAQKLRKVIAGKMVYISRSQEKWTVPFMRLRRKYGTEHIQNVLDFYCKNCGREKLPKLKDAYQFMQRFDWIENVYKKSCQCPSVTPSAEAMSMATRLKSYGGSVKGHKDLPQFIEVSLQNYKKFKASLLAKTGTDERLRRLANAVLSKLGSPPSFVEKWIDLIHKQFSKWDKWNGNLMSQVFTTTHKKFTEMTNRFAAAYGGLKDAQQFTTLLEQCNEDSAK